MSKMNCSCREDMVQSRPIKVLCLVKGFHGGVAKFAARLSLLNERPNIELRTIVINNRRALCNRADLDSYGLEEIPVKGFWDFSWMKPCVEIIHRFSPDLLLIPGGFRAAIMAWALQRKVKCPLPYLASNRGNYQKAPNAKLTPRECIYYLEERLTPWLYQHRAFAVSAVAEHCKQYLVSRGVDADKITVIHNGLAPETPRCGPITRESASLKDDDIVIGTIARMEPEKGLDYLVDAFAIIARDHPRVHLLIVGDGRDSNQLQQQYRRLGVESRVHLIGYQDYTQPWLDLFDIFVLPSLREGHSNALLEAMRSGKVIVATDVPGNKESVNNEREALLVPSKDAAALARALDRLLKDRELANSLAEAAKRRFEECFTINHMLDQTAAWLRKCAQSARSN